MAIIIIIITIIINKQGQLDVRLWQDFGSRAANEIVWVWAWKV